MENKGKMKGMRDDAPSVTSTYPLGRGQAGQAHHRSREVTQTSVNSVATRGLSKAMVGGVLEPSGRVSILYCFIKVKKM